MIRKSEQDSDKTAKATRFFPAVLFYVIVLTTLPYSIFAQDLKPTEGGKKTSGEIAIDTSQAQKKDPYRETQDSTLNYFKGLKGQLQEAARSGRKLLIPDANAIQYLNGLYLFCSIKRGTCPSVLEALFEIDVVNSKLNNVAVCPVTKTFWKRWLENEFEDRMKYSLSTGFIAKVSEFNAKERPKYLRCDDTLKELFKDGTPAAALFSARYAPGGRVMHAIDEVITLITAVSENNINVFVATGAQS